MLGLTLHMILILFSGVHRGRGAAWRTANFALNQISAVAAFVADIAGALERRTARQLPA
jgi:hypothetical protein